MARIETQLSDYVDQGDLIEPANYRVVDVLQSKPAKLTKLEAAETRAHALFADFKRNYVDLAEAISSIIDTDLWKQSGYQTVRDYCREQLGWSYEWCRRIINGVAAVQNSELLTEAPSNAVATELARLPEEGRAEAIKTLTADDAPLTAERVKAYREVSEEGLPATSETISKYIDAGIEQRVMREARKHSQPAAMLRRLADEMGE